MRALQFTAAVGLGLALIAASNNGDVEWDGLAHIVGDIEYRPDGDPSSASDTTTMRVRTYKGDVTSAGVLVAPEGGSGADFVYVGAVWAYNDVGSTYDFWEVVVPGAAGARRYCLQVEDIAAGDPNNIDVNYLAEPHASSYNLNFDVVDARPDPAACWLLPAPSGTDGGQADTALPDTSLPDTASPDGGAPDVETPDIAAPDTVFPDSARPDSSVPDSMTLDGATPDSALPDTASPDSLTPDTSTPDSAQPDTAIADAGAGTDSGNCVPGCSDENHRVVCGADGEPLVVPCSGGTVCKEGRCAAETQPPVDQPEDEGCGCAASSSNSWCFVGFLLLLLLTRRQRRLF